MSNVYTFLIGYSWIIQIILIGTYVYTSVLFLGGRKQEYPGETHMSDLVTTWQFTLHADARYQTQDTVNFQHIYYAICLFSNIIKLIKMYTEVRVLSHGQKDSLHNFNINSKPLNPNKSVTLFSSKRGHHSLLKKAKSGKWKPKSTESY